MFQIMPPFGSYPQNVNARNPNAIPPIPEHEILNVDFFGMSSNSWIRV